MTPIDITDEGSHELNKKREIENINKNIIVRNINIFVIEFGLK